MRCIGPSEDECPKLEALNENTAVSYKLFRQTKIVSKDVTINLDWSIVRESQGDVKTNLAKALQERFNEGVAAGTYKVTVTNVRSAAQISETDIKDQLNATKDAAKRRRAKALPHMNARPHTLASALTELRTGVLAATIPVASDVPSLSLSTTRPMVPTKVSVTPTKMLTEVPTVVSSMKPTEPLTEKSSMIQTETLGAVPTKVSTEIPIQMPTAVPATETSSVLSRLSDVSGVSLKDLPPGAPRNFSLPS